MNKRFFSFFCALMLGGSFSASADTASGSLPVSTTVSNSCFLANPGSANFGNYDPTGPTSLLLNSSLSLRCTKGTTASISMDKGLNSASGATCTSPGRQMINGANTLPYSIFSPSGFEFGCSSDSSYTITSASGTTLQTVTYKGRISRGIDVPAGIYTDTVTVELTF